MYDASIPQLNGRGLRQFGFLTGGIIAGLFGLFFPILLDRSLPAWPWLVLATLTIWSLWHPTSLRPVYQLWMRFGHIMGRITTPLILGLLFFAMISPIGLLRKMLRKDSLSRNLDPGAVSYRIKSTKPTVDNLKRPF